MPADEAEKGGRRKMTIFGMKISFKEIVMAILTLAIITVCFLVGLGFLPIPFYF